MGDAGALFIAFSGAAVACAVSPALWRFLQRKRHAHALPVTALVAELEAARARVAGLLPEALSVVSRSEAARAAARARRARDTGPLPLVQLSLSLDAALALADAAHFARDGAVAEAVVTAALTAHAHEATVAAAAARVREAHPLHAAPAHVLALQARIVELEVAEHAAAVEHARDAGVALDSAAFGALLAERLAARLGGSGGGGSASLSPIVLRSDPAFAPRAPLWAHIVGFALREAAASGGPSGSGGAVGAAPRDAYVDFADRWSGLMAEQKARLRALGLAVA